MVLLTLLINMATGTAAIQLAATVLAKSLAKAVFLDILIIAVIVYFKVFRRR